MTGKTVTHVNSQTEMLSQRVHAMQNDRRALWNVSVLAQIYVSLSLYLYGAVSTAGLWSLGLTVPYMLLILFLSNRVRPVSGFGCLVFFLLQMFDAQLILYALSAMLKEVMPEHPQLLLALFLAIGMAWANSGKEETALYSLNRFLQWVIFALLFYCVCASIPYGRGDHFFPLFGRGCESIFKGAVCLWGAVNGCVWPRLMPNEEQMNSSEKVQENNFHAFLPLAGGALVMGVSVWLMPFYAMERPETLGWRLLLFTNMTPSIPAWSFQVISLLMLFFLSLSCHIKSAENSLSLLCGKKLPSFSTLLLLFLPLLPLVFLSNPQAETALITASFFRAPVMLGFLFLLYIQKRRNKRRKDIMA